MLSIAIITKDEEANLPTLLKSLETLRSNLSIQVVLVDTGSQDATVSLAAAWGAHCHTFKWIDDFSAARNESLRYCVMPWILWLDADDRLTPETVNWLSTMLARFPNDHVGTFSIHSPQANLSEIVFNQIRLFPNHRGIHFEGRIHESVSPSLRQMGFSAIYTHQKILHSGYGDEKILLKKHQRNIVLLEQEIAEKEGKQLRAPASIYFALARTYHVQNQLQAAEQHYRKICISETTFQENPDIFLAAHLYLGQCLGFQSRCSEALSWMLLHSEKGKQNAQYQFELGKLLYVEGKIEAANTCFSNCLCLGPSQWSIPTEWNSIFEGARQLLGNSASEKIPLTVCTIIKNEMPNLPALIDCIDFNRIEWIVVDTGSTDGSVEWLRSKGISAKEVQWNNDFSQARNASLKLASRAWILWLDADDRPDLKFWNGVTDLLKNPAGQKNAFRLLVRNPRSEGPGEVLKQIRIIPNHQEISFQGKIHEELGTSLSQKRISIEDTEIELLHMGYWNAQQRQEKAQRNRLALEEEYQFNQHDAVLAMEFGNSLFQCGDYRGAKAIYLHHLEKELSIFSATGALRQNPPDLEALRHFPLLIAETALQIKDTEQCEEWMQVALQWNPQSLKPDYYFGKKALDDGQLDQALQHFEKTLAKPIVYGTVAQDLKTIRKNALGFAVLCRIKKTGTQEASPVKEYLLELLEEGLETFPLDPQVAADFFTAIEDWNSLSLFLEAKVIQNPNNIAWAEDWLESLIVNENFQHVIVTVELHPNWLLNSPIISAFMATSLEKLEGAQANTLILEIIRPALKKWPNDATLIVYFSEWVNRSRRFKEAYSILNPLRAQSQELDKLALQIEQLGLSSLQPSTSGVNR